MKLSCLQENLRRGLATVSRAVAGKSSLPVLANVLLATDSGRLKLAATNLELGITCWIGAKVDGDGAVTVPARLFTDMVGGMPNDRVDLNLDSRTQTLHVACGRFEANIKGIEAEEFPNVPTSAGSRAIATFPPQALRDAIAQVAFAAATDDTRPVLAGVLLRLRGTRVQFAAADGFRLAQRSIELAGAGAADQDIIVPARTLLELSRIIDDEHDIEIIVTQSQVLFHTPSLDVVSRLIDGRYPDIDRVIPTSHTTRAVLDTQEFAKAARLASFVAASSSNIVRLTLESGGDLGPGRVIVNANAAEVGDNRGALDANIGGPGGQIALNVKYLADALAAMKTPQVALEFENAQSPAVFRPVGADGYVHVIMPMAVR